jgi:toxin-antitoxin system PIN domain toxin
VKALDTNVLVHAHRTEMTHHHQAAALVRALATGEEPWSLPWPCVYEFLRVVTHPRVFDPPTPISTALRNVATLLASPSVVMLGEGPRHGDWLRKVLDGSRICGNLVFDAHVAALLREHGVDEIVTSDADFLRFKGLRVTDPYPGPAPA